MIFEQKLKEHIDTRKGKELDQRIWVLDTYSVLRAAYEEWEDETVANNLGNSRDVAFLDDVQACYDKTEEYFDKFVPNFYRKLVCAHITHAVQFWGDATQHIDKKTARIGPSWMRDWVVEGAYLYWDYLPKVAAMMKDRFGVDDEELVNEAWIMMMFRAFCWWRCHWMDLREASSQTKTRLPSKYADSKFPVYIG